MHLNLNIKRRNYNLFYCNFYTNPIEKEIIIKII